MAPDPRKHGRDLGLHAVVDAVQHHRQRAVPPVVRIVGERRHRRGDPGVVVGDLRPPNVATAKANHGLPRRSGSLTSVRTKPACPPAAFDECDGLPATVLVDVGHHHGGTLAGEDLCRRHGRYPSPCPSRRRPSPRGLPSRATVPAATPPGYVSPMRTPEQSPRLAGRVALVSGAAGGIGAACGLAEGRGRGDRDRCRLSSLIGRHPV